MWSLLLNLKTSWVNTPGTGLVWRLTTARRRLNSKMFIPGKPLSSTIFRHIRHRYTFRPWIISSQQRQIYCLRGCGSNWRSPCYYCHSCSWFCLSFRVIRVILVSEQSLKGDVGVGVFGFTWGLVDLFWIFGRGLMFENVGLSWSVICVCGVGICINCGADRIDSCGSSFLLRSVFLGEIGCYVV